MAPKQQDICSFKVNTSTGNLISSWKKQQNTKKTQCYKLKKKDTKLRYSINIVTETLKTKILQTFNEHLENKIFYQNFLLNILKFFHLFPFQCRYSADILLLYTKFSLTDFTLSLSFLVPHLWCNIAKLYKCNFVNYFSFSFQLVVYF